jgi:uncharacterized protein (DUF4415 family)
MNENSSQNRSLTDWERVGTLTDDEIDTNDIPPLDEDFFANAELRMPEPQKAVTIRVDKDVLDWFKSQGKGYQTHLNAVLRMYVEGNRLE